MNVLSRGIRNAFRNGIRTVAIVGMLALSIGLALSMLLAHQAVGQKIDSVQKSVGNVITVAPAGIRGFMGGGEPLTADQVKALSTTAHVVGIDTTLADRLNSTDTNLEPAIDAGSFGRRQMRIESRDGTGGASKGDVPPDADGGGMPNPASVKMPLAVVGANNPLAAIPAANGDSLNITSGTTFDGGKDALVALIGSSLAEKNNIKVGSTFTAYGQMFTVSGIFDAGNTFSNNQLIMPLPTVQRLSAQPGAVTGATIHIDSAVNLDSATAAIKSSLGDKADVTNEAESVKTTLSSLQNIHNVSLFSLIGAAGTAAIITLLTMVMIVRERRREIGVLKAVGGSNVRVMLQFTIEAITLTVLGALAGVIIGALAATPVTKMLANNASADTPAQTTTFSAGASEANGPKRGGGFSAQIKDNSVSQGVKNLKANVSPGILAYGLGGAILIAIVGSTAAAGLIARVRPAEVMRAE